MEIKRVVEVQLDREQLEKIFFDNSLIKTFKNSDEREKFFNRWCGQYLKDYPTQFYLALIEKRLVGYLAGHTDSKKALSEFQIPGYDLFEEYYDQYPAHLHINCDVNHQGMGIGKKLMMAYIDELRDKGIAGVHIITSIGAKNSGFYAALGFDIVDFREFKGSKLIMMGKKLC